MEKSGVKSNFDYGKLSKKLPGIIAANLNILGNWINKAIQDGIKNGKDVDGNPFASLSPKSTLPMRNRDGYGFTKLKISGTMKKTKRIPATKNRLQFEIQATGKSLKTKPLLNGKKVKRKNAGQIYGAYHNQSNGYITSSDSAIPNKKVPQRKWFGIPKSAQPGGKIYQKASLNRKLHIRAALRKLF